MEIMQAKLIRELNPEETPDKENLPLIEYLEYMLNFYGLVPYKLYVAVFNAHNERQITENEFDLFLEESRTWLESCMLTLDRERKVVYLPYLDMKNSVDKIINNIHGSEYYFPTREELAQESTEENHPVNEKNRALVDFMMKSFSKRKIEIANRVCVKIKASLRICLSKDYIKSILEDGGLTFKTKKQERAFWEVVASLDNRTPKWFLYGHTPENYRPEIS